MLFKIYAGVDGKTDSFGMHEFNTQQQATAYALDLAFQEAHKYKYDETDTVTLNFSAEEITDD